MREVIALGETEERSFYEIMETNTASGWCTFDQSLAKAHLAGTITEETASLYATNRNRLTRYFDEGSKQLGRPRSRRSHSASMQRLRSLACRPCGFPPDLLSLSRHV